MPKTERFSAPNRFTIRPTLRKHDPESGKWTREENVAIKAGKGHPNTNQANIVVGDHHYFLSHNVHYVGRVHVESGAVEYLEVPSQLLASKKSRKRDTHLWGEAHKRNKPLNARGFAVGDKGHSGTGWGHISAASPILVGRHLFCPVVTGTVYVIDTEAETFDESALIAVNDLGPGGETWTLGFSLLRRRQTLRPHDARDHLYRPGDELRNLLLMKPLLAGLLALLSVSAFAAEPWIIDPHTHFKGEAQIAHEGKGKKQNPKNSLDRVVVPEDYRELADRLEIQSTLITEAIDQDQPQFNDWIFEQAKKSDLVCGYTAREDLTNGNFLERHERYKKTGYLNGYRFRREELNGYLSNETARRHLKQLERDGMVVDLLIDPSHAPDAIRLAREFPDLKIVINHCFRARLVDGKVDDAWKKAVKDCAAFPNVHMKISSILNFAGTQPFVESAPGEMEGLPPRPRALLRRLRRRPRHFRHELGRLRPLWRS